MNIIVVGLSHKTATVEIREKVAFSPNSIEQPLQGADRAGRDRRGGDCFHLQPGRDLRHHP